mmetsp:Transcript_22148/g.49510  ORF Transcript_22148/g.49510 Transcript_22148/m.49510 type:complete len:217 (+) Transcript_22148:3462-4112(+)
MPVARRYAGHRGTDHVRQEGLDDGGAVDEGGRGRRFLAAPAIAASLEATTEPELPEVARPPGAHRLSSLHPRQAEVAAGGQLDALQREGDRYSREGGFYPAVDRAAGIDLPGSCQEVGAGDGALDADEIVVFLVPRSGIRARRRSLGSVFFFSVVVVVVEPVGRNGRRRRGSCICFVLAVAVVVVVVLAVTMGQRGWLCGTEVVIIVFPKSDQNGR